MTKKEQVKFVIHVEFQQNATWQGTITWVEKNKKQRFRSMMEMHRLMEEAMDNYDGFTSWDK